MSLLRTRSYSIYGQYAISLFIIAGTSILCLLFTDLIGYRAVALILLMAVSLNAILFDILPVILSALLSALIWNFFFIPPILTFHIGTPEDALMFLMYFVYSLDKCGADPQDPRGGAQGKGRGTAGQGHPPLWHIAQLPLARIENPHISHHRGHRHHPREQGKALGHGTGTTSTRR
jgi:hypothetical protein